MIINKHRNVSNQFAILYIIRLDIFDFAKIEKYFLIPDNPLMRCPEHFGFLSVNS